MQKYAKMVIDKDFRISEIDKRIYAPLLKSPWKGSVRGDLPAGTSVGR